MPTAVPLESLFAAIRADLEVAAREPGHPWRTPVLVTGGAAPDGRVVVLRRFERDPDYLVSFTDVRGPKVAALRQDSRAVWVFYNPATRQQVRVTTSIALHHRDARASQDWAALAPANLIEYATAQPPGGLMSSAHPIPSASPVENFAVLRGRIESWDCLRLGSGGAPHQRFGWSGGRGTWLVP